MRLELEVDERLDAVALDLQYALDEDYEGYGFDDEWRAHIGLFYFGETCRGYGVDGYGGNHQPYEQSAGLIKDWQDCGVEVGEDLLYHEPCCCETVGAEEYPQHNDEMERDEPAQHLEY